MNNGPAEDEAYGIEKHAHVFAAWAASRAASVKGCRFSVMHGRTVLEKGCGFSADFSTPDKLPDALAIDATHREWRNKVINLSTGIESSGGERITFTHGIAAKLINVYLKSRFVCGGHHKHRKVEALHPPIDRLLLEKLSKIDSGEAKKLWTQARDRGWSNLNSTEYELLILQIREHLHGEPLWTIERYWIGHQ